MIIANERAIKFFHHLLFKKMTKTILSRDMKLICGDINLIYVIIIFFKHENYCRVQHDIYPRLFTIL